MKKESSKVLNDVYERKRRYNTIIFCLMFFAAGLESVLTNSTLLAYLKTLVQTKNTHIWYGVISCSYYVMDIFSSFILAPYVDRTRNIRVIILLCICFIIAGNLVYVIHFSPYFLFSILHLRHN